MVGAAATVQEHSQTLQPSPPAFLLTATGLGTAADLAQGTTTPDIPDPQGEVARPPAPRLQLSDGHCLQASWLVI